MAACSSDPSFALPVAPEADAGLDDDSATASPEGGSLAPDAGPVVPATSAVRVIVLPGTDKGIALRDAIRNAKKSVHVTMYLFTSNMYEQAIIDAKKAGRDVQVVLNGRFPDGVNSNLGQFNAFKAAGVPVVYGPPIYQFTHQKSVIIDGTEAWIMTMNMTNSSPTDNREFLVVDTDPSDVADAEAIFQADFKNVDVTVKGKLVVSPQQASTPDARSRILSLINNARLTLSVEAETFSDTEVTAGLVAAKKRGLAVKVVLDGNINATPAQQTAMAALKAAGISVVTVTTPTIHSKTIVADGVRAYVGSQNFTTNSLLNNRELGVIFDNAAAVKTVESTVLADHAAGKPL